VSREVVGLTGCEEGHYDNESGTKLNRFNGRVALVIFAAVNQKSDFFA
jgi:hypothetical protein